MKWLLWAGPCVLLGAALFELPYGYYQLLRVAVFLTALFHLWESVSRANHTWAWIFGAMALVYNPLTALSLGRTLWTAVNLATICMLLAHWRYVSMSQSSRNPAAKENSS